MSSPKAAWIRGAPTVAACACAASVVLAVLWLAGRPLATPDLWFHLKAGETYWHQGLWPAHDPMLFTAYADGPVQHEWLFGVLAYGVERAVGFQGLRIAHVLIVAGIVALVARLAYREVRSWAAVAAVLVGFVVLSWQRLEQFKPDLWSVPATLIVYAAVVRPSRGPTRRALVATTIFVWLWFNAHSLAGIGLAITGVALLAATLERAILSSTLRAEADVVAVASRRMRWLAMALLAFVAFSLVHPRGADQVLTFFISSSQTAVWEIADEWAAFAPLRYADNSGTLPWLTWLLADGILLAIAVIGLGRLQVLRRKPSLDNLTRLDPVPFLVAVACCGAMLISIRLLWLGVFPLLYVVAAVHAWAQRRPFVLHAGYAAAAIALTLALPGPGGFRAGAGDTPSNAHDYLANPVNRVRFAEESVAFLRDTQVEGRLFNPYEIGAYIGYYVAPRLRTFIDSRTEHYPAAVFQEWKAVTLGARLSNGRDWQQILEDRRVDFFLGLGPPAYAYSVPYTLDRVEREAGWILVFRTAGQCIYMRQVPRNAGNLDRIAAYYERAGVPFDRVHGLDVAQVLRVSADWALAHGLVPPEMPHVWAAAHRDGDAAQVLALTRLSEILFVAGDYRGAAIAGRRALALNPKSSQPASLAARALVRAGHAQEAASFVTDVLRDHATAPWIDKFRAEFGAHAAAPAGS